MKTVIAFLAGVLIASGTVYFLFDARSEHPVLAQAVTQVAKPAPDEVPSVAPEPIVVEPAAPEPRPVVTLRPRRPLAVHEPEPVAVAQDRPSPMPVAAVVTPPPAPVEPAIQVVEPPPVERIPNTVTLSANTRLVVRLAEAISTEKQGQGETFEATLDQPLVVDGFVIAERGARVEGRIAALENSGRAHLELELLKLHTADGQRLNIRTNTYQRDAERSIRDDVAKAGIGAALGAAIGAMAGGGKGAAIGAGAGGATGTGVAIATRNKNITLPVETLITFRLSLPVTIKEQLQ